MKNSSLFKRAFATVATVPLALTQCLAVANAVDVDNVAVVSSTKAAAPAEDVISVDTIMYIEPTESDNAMYYLEDGKYIKDSYWNTTISKFIQQLNAKAPNGTLDPKPIFEKVINRAGAYADLAQKAADKVNEATYSVDTNNNIVVNATMDDIVPVFEDFAKEKVGSDLDKIADEYNMPELKTVKFFDGVEIAGSIEIVIDASELSNIEGKTINGKISFTDKATGTVYNDDAIADYFKNKLNELKDAASSTIESLKTDYDFTDEEIAKRVEESQEYKDLFAKVKDGYQPEDGEIESMILESVEFKNLVNDYMADHGVDYAEAESKIKESEDYQNMVERFTNGVNLTDAEIKEILNESSDYKDLVNQYMADNAVDYDTAVDEVLKSDDYQALLDKYTDMYTYTDDEIHEMIKGSADYQVKMAEIKAEYEDTYSKMEAKADDAQKQLNDIVGKALSYIDKGLEKYTDIKTYTGSYQFDSYSDMAEAINNNVLFKRAVDTAKDKLPDKYASKVPEKVPTDLSKVSGNNKVQEIFAEIINQLGAKLPGYEVNVTPEELTDIVESCTDIEITANAGLVTFTGILPDEDVNNDNIDAATYIENTYGVEVSDIDGDGKAVYKEADITLDFTNLDTDGNASVEFQLKRVVEAKKPDETTTAITATSTETETGTGTETVTTATGSETETGTGTETETGTGTETVTTATGSETETGTGTGTETVTTATGSETETGTGTETETGTGTGSETETVTTATGSETETGTGTGTGTETGTGTGSETETVTTATGSETGTGTGTETGTGTTSSIEIVGTTTVTVEYTVRDVEVESVDAFYLTIDKTFNKNQVLSVKYDVVISEITVDEADQIISKIDNTVAGTLTADQFDFDGTPAEVYNGNAEGIDKFIYDVALVAAEDITVDDVVIFNAGDVIKSDNTIAPTVTAYIGVKGDADLDGKADSSDASVILAWYSKASTGQTDAAFSISELVVNAETGEIINATLDRFAAFLSDVDNENDPDNWKESKAKTDRKVGADDASFVLACYSTMSTTATDEKYASREVWNEILGEAYAKIED